MQPELIHCGQYVDHRGTITFLNEFNMEQVKRFYVIQNKDTEVIRAWRAHKIEQRWFHVACGEFLIRVVKIENWDTPDPKAEIQEFSLSEKNNQVLHLPKGYGSWIKAVEENSKLIVFADYPIENASLDDYQYSPDYFTNQSII